MSAFIQGSVLTLILKFFTGARVSTATRNNDFEYTQALSTSAQLNTGDQSVSLKSVNKASFL